EEVIHVPAAQNQVRRLAHSGAELLALPHWRRKEPAYGKVMRRVKAGRSEVGAAVVGVLPIRAVRSYGGAPLVAQMFGQRLRERVSGEKLEAAAHPVPRGYLQRVVAAGPARFGEGNVADVRQGFRQRPPVVQIDPRTERPRSGKRLIGLMRHDQV